MLPIRALSRDELHEALRNLSSLKQATDSLPHHLYRTVGRLIDETHDLIGDTLPGGFAGYCEMSGEPLGHNEVAYTDRENGGIYSASAFEEMRRAVAADDTAAQAPVGEGLALAEGVYYRSRDGQRVGPLAVTSSRHVLRHSHPFECFGRLYQANGRYVSDTVDSPHDLVGGDPREGARR